MGRGIYIFCLIIDIALAVALLITGFVGAKLALTVFGILFIVDAIKACTYDLYVFQDEGGEITVHTWLFPVVLFGGMAALCFILRDKATDFWLNILNGICLVIFAVVGMFFNPTFRVLLKNRVGQVLGWFAMLAVLAAGVLSAFQQLKIFYPILYVSIGLFFLNIVFGIVFINDALDD